MRSSVEILMPVSSYNSRTAPSAAVSPLSIEPPVTSHLRGYVLFRERSVVRSLPSLVIVYTLTMT